MKFFKPLNILLLVCIINFSIFDEFVEAQNVKDDQGQKYNQVSIFYTNPTLLHLPSKIVDIERTSEHELFVGNIAHIKNLRALFNRALNNYGKSSIKFENYNRSVAIKVVFHQSISLKESWFVDRDGNFSWSKDKEMIGKDEKLTDDMKGKEKGSFVITLEGKLSKELFNELNQFCQQLINVVDLRYQRNKMYWYGHPPK